MATYLELATLAGNLEFLARIAYAVGNYAAYIAHEAENAPNHMARWNWSLRASGSPELMARSLAAAVCRDANVMANLAGVTDADLQTAVETAANELIAVPISYHDLMMLASDQVFLRRAQIAVAHFAAYILNEAPNTANHPARFAWARNAILNTFQVAVSLAPAVMMDATVAANLMGTTDAQLQAAVEYEAQQLLL